MFTWNPDREIFHLPYVDHSVTWYGFLFALAFFLGYLITRHLLTFQLMQEDKGWDEAKKNSTLLTDKLSLFVIIGVVLGARLGHVFFYDWNYFKHHPFEILQIWQGGLASHGGAIGVLVMVYLFSLSQRKKFPMITFLAILDAIMIPAALIASFIRVGNFINQEILGTPTTLPWGVTFLNPVQEVPLTPLHPVQLYEALSYFLIFLFLLVLWRFNGKKLGEGLLTGWFFVLTFSCRFFFEFVKLPQSDLFDEQGKLNMGQLLSLPFILLGFFLILRFYYRKRRVRGQ